LIAGLSYLSGYFGWWTWDFALIAFLVAYFTNANGWSSFLSGFLGIGILWFVLSTLMNGANDGLLAGKVSEILKLPSSMALIIATALIGGLVGGFSALTGSLFRAVINPPKSRRLKVGRTYMRQW
jgi:ABC-type phosphate/phosphonate transport system permease subunit